MLKDLAKSIGMISEAVKYVAALIAVLAFLVFFALSPLHALVLSGLLIILAAFAGKADAAIQKYALFLGIAIILVGGMGIFLPSVARALLSLAENLKDLMLLEV